MKKLIAVLFFMSLFISESSAGDSVLGDVIVVLRNNSQSRIDSAKTAGGIKSLSAVQSFVASQNVKVVETFDSLSDNANKIFMVVHSDTENENELLRRIKSRPDVIAASLNNIHTLDLPEVPNDSEYFRLWGMEAINAPKAWTYGVGSDDVYVAIIDTGVDYNHPDLKDNFSHEYSRNFYGHAGSNYEPSAYYDVFGHGTHIAGTIAGVGNNSLGVAGVNWKAKIISLRIASPSAGITDADTIAAFNYISELLAKDSRLKIAAVNYSVSDFSTITPEEAIAENYPLWLALKTLSDTDRTVICCSAGNNGIDIGRPTQSTTSDWQKGSYKIPPSFLRLDNKIVVAAATHSLKRASFSNYSQMYVDITAPGADIFSTLPLTLSNDTGYATISAIYPYGSRDGTSMSTPHVAGSAALLKAIFPSATASQIKAAILGGANSDYLRDDGTSAYGMLDLTGAINFMAGIMSSDTPPVISDANPPAGVVNQRYKTEFYAAGTQPLTWTVDGEIPAGLVFSDGKISGTPKEAGTFPFTVTASNKNGSNSLALTITISAQEAPVIRRPDEDYKLRSPYVKTDYKTDIETSAGDWPMKWRLGSGDYPADFGAKINEDSGILSFNPTKTGTFSFPVTVSNDSGSDSYTFKLTVRDVQAAAIVGTSVHPVALGRPVNMDFDSTEKKLSAKSMYVGILGTHPLSWDMNGLPKGVGYTVSEYYTNPLVKILMLTGRAEESGDFSVTVTVSNDWGVASTDILIKVEDKAPVFANDINTFRSVERDTEFSFPVPVYGSAPITFTTSGDIPAGTQVRYEDNTPIFYGKPTRNGHYTFTIIAENSAGKSEGTFDLYVHEPSEIITHILPDAIKGVSYDAKINLRSGINMTWKISADESLNLKISQSGNITGIPSKEGQFTISVAAESSDISAQTEAAYALTVRAMPVIKTSSLAGGKISTEYTAAILSADGTAPITWSVSEGKLPEGLMLSQNGYIYGTPKESGTFIFTIEAENKAGHDTRTFTVNIAGGSQQDRQESPDIPVTPESQDIPPEPESQDIPVKPQVKISEGKTRDISSLTIGELAAINAADGVIAAILPEISTNVEGFYTFESIDCFANVKLSDDVTPGWTLVWNAFTRGTAVDALSMRDAEDDNVQFTDSEGHITLTVPDNRVVNVSAWLDAGVVYAPVISAVEHRDDAEGVPSANSGGCCSFSGTLILSVPLIFVKLRRR